MPTQCHNCGSPLDESAVACAQCGQSADEPALSISFASVSAPAPTLAGTAQQGETPLFSEVAASTDRGLTGIGGWLILQAIGLALGPFFVLFALARDCRLLFGTSGQMVFAKLPGLEAVLLYEAITNVFFFSTLIALNILFYKKKKAFPTFISIFFVARFVLLLADHIMAARFNPNAMPTDVIQAFVVCVIWIPYFLRSRRVELTFVN
jgi:hypothetical protein